MAPLHSYAVIIPVLNGADTLGATLDSVLASLEFFDATHPRSAEVAGEVVVVDDGSRDGTADVVAEAARRDPRVRLVSHHRNYGIGPARNTGARAAAGDVLFFCDGDDLFLPEHVFVGFSILECSAEADHSPGFLRIGSRGHLVRSSSAPVPAVRTGVRLRDAIRPEWHAAVQQTIAQCLCLRRECHDWTEGFPEAEVYRRVGCEDGAYAATLQVFFRVGVIDLETVEYVRRPGNSLDRQMPRFTHPPGSCFDVLAPDLVPIHAVRQRLENDRIGYLLEKWSILGPPDLDPACLNWAGVVRELTRRGLREAAHRVADEARSKGQWLPPD